MTFPEQQRRSILERLYHCKTATIAIARHPDMQTRDSSRLLDAMDRFLQAALVAFEDSWSDAARRPAARAKEEQELLCLDYSDVLQELTSVLLPALDGANPQHVPVHIASVIERYVRQYAHSLNIGWVVLSSSYEYNYSVRHYQFSEWYERIGIEPPEDSVQSFLILTIPRFERDSASLHAVLLGHELAHVRAWASKTTSGLPMFVPPELVAGASPTQTEAIEELCVIIQSSWYEEFAADIYAALCFGPASLLALGELTGPAGPIDVDFTTHPSTAKRLAVVMPLLADAGFLDMAGVADLLEGYLRVPPDHPTDPLKARLWGEVRLHLAEVVQRCIGTLSDSERFRADRWDEVVEGADMLADGLPIGEVSSGRGYAAGDVPVILNAVWLRKMRGLDSLAEQVGLNPRTISGMLRANGALDQLVLKSFEISAVMSDTP